MHAVLHSFARLPLDRRAVVHAAAMTCPPRGATLEDVNRRLARLGEPPVTSAELAKLEAAR